MFINHIAAELHELLKNDLKKEEVLNILEVPSNEDFGDYSFPTFALA